MNRMNTFLYIPPTRSPVDDKVHRIGKDLFLDLSRRHRIHANETHPKDIFFTIQTARKAKAYAKAREEQQLERDIEDMTNQFARLSINDVSVTDVFPLTR